MFVDLRKEQPVPAKKYTMSIPYGIDELMKIEAKADVTIYIIKSFY